jgi:hypothetical protein
MLKSRVEHLSQASSSVLQGSARPGSLPGWVREPLVHFVLIGFVLFGVDHLAARRVDDPHTIVVTADVDNEARKMFRAERGRDPDRAELEALHKVWLDNEVLYREGLAMQVDRGDDAIRERVIFKALSVVDANVKLLPMDDKGLRAWFEAHRSRYDEPARFDFEEAVLSGDTSESAVRAFVDVLNTGTPGDARAGLRVFKGRPVSNLVQSYGADFPKALEEGPVGVWRAIHSRDGWRAIRAVSVTQPKPASFEVLRNVVRQDWADAAASEQRSAAVGEMTKKYVVKYQ